MQEQRRAPIPQSNPDSNNGFEGESGPADLERTPFQLDEFRIDPKLNRISHAEGETRITPRTMEVLLALSLRAGQVMSRDEIFDAVWGDLIVGDEALTRCIADLRKAFGDNPREPRYIRTVPKRGYCLIPRPEPILRKEGFLGWLSSDAADPIPSWSRRARLTLFSVAASTLLVALAAGYSHLYLDPRKPLATRPLTTYAGVEFDAELDSGGDRLIYARRPLGQRNLDLFIQELSSGETTQLTDDSASDFSPTWGPRGERIAFIRIGGNGCEFVIRRLGDSQERILGSCGNNPTSDLTWSPAGEWLAYTDREAAGKPFGIYLIDAASGKRHLLVEPGEEHWGDKVPEFSPDGRRVAFIRSVGLGAQDLFLISTEGGPVRRVTRDSQTLAGHTWTRDGQHLIFSSLRGGHWGLWKVAVGGGEPEWLPVSSHQPRYPHAAARANRLVFEDQRQDFDLVAIDLASGSGTVLPVVDSTRLDLLPQLAPSGQKLLFVSDRSGSRQLWLQKEREVRRLTDLEGTFTGPPRWSPQEDQILFDHRREQESHLFRLDLRSGQVDQMTPAGSNHLFASYSMDGRNIYFGSDRSGRWQVWKMPASGGPAKQVTRNGGYGAQESADGRTLYFTKFNRDGLWALDFKSGEERFLEPTSRLTDRTHWISRPDGLYFIVSGPDGRQLRRLANPDAELELVSTLPRKGLGAGLALNAQNGQLIISQLQSFEQDLILLELEN